MWDRRTVLTTIMSLTVVVIITIAGVVMVAYPHSWWDYLLALIEFGLAGCLLGYTLAMLERIKKIWDPVAAELAVFNAEHGLNITLKQLRNSTADELYNLTKKDN